MDGKTAATASAVTSEPTVQISLGADGLGQPVFLDVPVSQRAKIEAELAAQRKIELAATLSVVPLEGLLFRLGFFGRAAKVASEAKALRPIVTLEQSVKAGLVNPSGKLAKVLGNIEKGFGSARPKNAFEALDVVGKGAREAGLDAGFLSATPAGEFVIRNVGGVVTTIFKDGAISISRGADILLQLSL